MKFCPHCKCPYESNTYWVSILKPKETSYGSPIKTCHHCKKVFIDRDYHEIAIEGIKKADRRRVSYYGCFSCVLGVGFGLCALISGVILIGCFLIGLGVYSYYREDSAYKERQAMIKIEAAASENRLKNPAYAAILKRLGYSVPSKYLSPAQNDLHGE